MNKSLAIIYIGIKNEEKDKIGKKNHEILFNLLEKNNIKYKIYDFTFNEPFHEKTNISQIKNFFHALKNTNENLIIKLRYDILIYENSFEILLNTIIDFINQKNYGYFLGGCCKTYMDNNFTYIDNIIDNSSSPVNDWIIMINKEYIISKKKALTIINNKRIKNGNKTWQLLLKDNIQIVNRILKIYLIRIIPKDINDISIIIKFYRYQLKHKYIGVKFNDKIDNCYKMIDYFRKLNSLK